MNREEEFQAFSTELEVQACSKLFEVAKDYLLKLACCASFILDLGSNDGDGKEFLGNSFALLRELGKLSNRGGEIEELSSNYKSKLSKSITSKELESLFGKEYAGDREWVDELNYIYVWVLNTYKISLKTASIADIQRQNSSKEKEESEAKVSLLEKSGIKKTREKESEWTKDGTFIYKHLFSKSGVKTIGDDKYGFEEIVSKTQALERLEREIRSGKVYIYLSKPERNPILKKYLSYLFFGGLITSVAVFLKFFVVIIGGSSNSGDRGTAESILFSIMSFIFFWLSRKENNRNLENANFRYSFSKKIFYYFFFLSSFFIFDHNSLTSLVNWGNNVDQALNAALMVALIVLVIGSFVIFLVLFFFCNPKVDKALREELLRKYSDAPYLK